MTSLDHDVTVRSVLDAIRSPEGPLGSGSAVALALSLGIECLALDLELTRRAGTRSEHEAYHAALGDRLEQWRRTTRRVFVEDPAHFGVVIEERRARDAAEGAQKATHVEQELAALALASRTLAELVDVAIGLVEDGESMRGGRGAPHADGEAATAAAFGRAAGEAIAVMLRSNADAVRRRSEQFGLATEHVDVMNDVVEDALRRLRELGASAVSADPDAAREEMIATVVEAWDDAGVRGLCGEGRFEAAVGALRARSR